MMLNVHIGEEIKKRIKEKGITIVWFSSQLSCTRANVYKIFEKKSLDTDLLLRISVILDYDFFELYSEEKAKKHKCRIGCIQ